jgi:choline kinase
MRTPRKGPSKTAPASESRGQSSIKAIILAAGRGRRLGFPKPKALLEFDGRTLLARHITALQAHGVHDISITVGYRSEAIGSEIARLAIPHGVVLVDNPDYHQGSLVSLWVQRERLKSGASIVLMDADVLCDPRMIGRLLGAEPPNVLLLDQTIEPGDEPVKICVRGGALVDFAKKPVHPYDWHGESVGFFRFTAATAAALAERIDDYVETGRTSDEYEEAIRDLILARPDQFGYEDISDLPWTEIDFEVDVVRARREILPQIAGLPHV